jgi:hypothetical protein
LGGDRLRRSRARHALLFSGHRVRPGEGRRANPAGDWKRRLVRAYHRDIHAIHAQLGFRAPKAALLRIEVPDRARWIEPGGEYNKIGYHRVYGAKLVYAVDGGAERTVGITSMI